VSRRGASTEARGSVAGEGWSLGAAWLSPPPLARRRTGAGGPPPGPRPRTGPHGEPTATTARAGERANGQRPRAPGRRGQAAVRSCERSKPWHLRGPGRSAFPGPPARNDGCLPEPVKSAYGVPSGSATPPPDRTRPTLAEPCLRLFLTALTHRLFAKQDALTLKGVMDLIHQNAFWTAAIRTVLTSNRLWHDNESTPPTSSRGNPGPDSSALANRPMRTQ
jgi:hypothetical protein